MELAETESLIRLLTDQMSKSKRVTATGELVLRISFGKSKRGFEFEDEEEFEDYVGSVRGDAVTFSQDGEGHSPFESKFGVVLREDSWKKPGKVAELIQFMYTDDTCKLFYGFTHEHGNSFYRIIMANLSSYKDASPFIQYLSDNIDSSPTKDIIDNKLLTIYNSYHQSDSFGVLPQLNKFPPTNESMCRVPPRYNDWKRHQTAATIITPNNFGSGSRIGDNCVGGNQLQMTEDEIIVVRFVCEENESCVIIQDPLNDNSKMSDVMLTGDVLDDLFDGDVSNVEKYKYKIRTIQSGFQLKWSQFENMTVGVFKRLKKNMVVSLLQL